MKKIL